VQLFAGYLSVKLWVNGLRGAGPSTQLCLALQGKGFDRDVRLSSVKALRADPFLLVFAVKEALVKIKCLEIILAFIE